MTIHFWKFSSSEWKLLTFSFVSKDTLFFFFFIKKNFWHLLISEREREREREREDTESEAGSRIQAVSTESDAGLELTNHVTMT